MAAYRLPKLGILLHLDDESLEILASFGEEKSFQSGETIVAEGQHQSRLYIVVYGALEAVAAANEEMILAELQPGDCYGEMSVLDPGPATATVRSISAGMLWFLDIEKLQVFAQEYPFGGVALLWGIDAVLSQRLSQAYDTVRTNAIIPQFLSVRAHNRNASATQRINL